MKLLLERRDCCVIENTDQMKVFSRKERQIYQGDIIVCEGKHEKKGSMPGKRNHCV